MNMVELSLNFNKTDALFSISASAAERIKELINLEGRENQALQIKVIPGGCAGFSYDMNWTAITDNGIKIEKNGATVIINEADMRLLNGGELDYVISLMGSKFDIKNPNAKSTCGCGKSWA